MHSFDNLLSSCFGCSLLSTRTTTLHSLRHVSLDQSTSLGNCTCGPACRAPPHHYLPRLLSGLCNLRSWIGNLVPRLSHYLSLLSPVWTRTSDYVGVLCAGSWSRTRASDHSSSCTWFIRFGILALSRRYGAQAYVRLCGKFSAVCGGYYLGSMLLELTRRLGCISRCTLGTAGCSVCLEQGSECKQIGPAVFACCTFGSAGMLLAEPWHLGLRLMIQAGCFRLLYPRVGGLSVSCAAVTLAGGDA